MILLMTKKKKKTTDQSTKMSLDLLECDHPKQHATNPLADLVALGMTPFLLKIFLKMTRKIRHADSKVFTLISSMVIAPKPQDSWPLSIDSCL